MKITIITGPFMCLPPDSIGAVEKLWSTVGECWRKKGENVQFICKKPDTTENRNNTNKTYIKGYGRTGSWTKDFFLDFVYSFKALCAVQDTDILILNSQWSPILIRLFRSRYKKAIYSVERFPKKQAGAYKRIGKLDEFRCCSTAVYNALLEQNPELSFCTWIVPNFIDTTIFSGEKKHVSKEPSVVYAGRIHREKGLDILVKAIDMLNEDNEHPIRLTLIGAYSFQNGGSGEEYKKELNTLAKNYTIEWVEPIYEPQKLADEIKTHDVFCYPSIANKGETFGVAPLEAMGVGLPVVLSSLDCFQDYFEEGVNGFSYNYEAENAAEMLAKRILQICQSPELYEELSRGALETSKRFSAELISERYLEKFEELL